MIIGNLKHLDKALLPKSLFNILSNNSFSFENLNKKSEGLYKVIEDSVFYIIIDTMTQPEDFCKSEFHNDYLDIQILLSGEEVIGVSNTIDNPLEYIEHKQDLFFIENDILKTRIILNPGDFAVFYPGEVHRPTCQINDSCKIKKAVFKIKKSWLADI